MRVGHHQIAVVGECQPCGPAVFPLGHPPRPEEVTIAVEDLDPSRHVDDVQLILIVNRHRTWFLKSPVRQAASTPDQFRLAVTATGLRASQHHHRQQAEREEAGQKPAWQRARLRLHRMLSLAYRQLWLACGC